MMWKEIVVIACVSIGVRMTAASSVIQRADKISTTQSTIPTSSTEPSNSENFTERVEEATQNAEAVEVFMEALENVIMEEGDVVTIPEDIDSEQHNITLEDALDRISDFVSVQMDELQNLLSEMENKMDELTENELPDEQLKGESLAALTGQKDEVLEVLEILTDAAEDIHDYRRSISGNSNDFYDMFDITDVGNDDYGDDEFPTTTSELDLTTAPTTSDSIKETSTKYNGTSRRQNKKISDLNSAQAFGDVLGSSLSKPLSRIVFTIGITLSLGLVVVIIVMMLVRWFYYLKRKRMMKIRSLPAWENSANVPVPHIGAHCKLANVEADLPSYLDVVSKRVPPPSYSSCTAHRPETNETTDRDTAKLVGKT